MASIVILISLIVVEIFLLICLPLFFCFTKLSSVTLTVLHTSFTKLNNIILCLSRWLDTSLMEWWQPQLPHSHSGVCMAHTFYLLLYIKDVQFHWLCSLLAVFWYVFKCFPWAIYITTCMLTVEALGILRIFFLHLYNVRKSEICCSHVMDWPFRLNIFFHSIRVPGNEWFKI